MIYDSHGRMIASALYDPHRALDIRMLAPGVYTLALNAKGETIGLTMFVKG
jgi:hypothetical protein